MVSKVIFNEDYIDELTRHRDNLQQKLSVEMMPNEKVKCMKQLNDMQNRLDWSIDFQDTIAEVKNIDIPKIAIVKTIHGYELPLRNVQILN